MYKLLCLGLSEEYVEKIRANLNSFFSLVVVKNSDDFVKAISNDKYSAALIALSSEEGSLLHLCNFVRKQLNEHFLPVIFLGTKFNSMECSMAYDQGADDVIDMAIDNFQLRARIASRIERFVAAEKSGDKISICGITLNKASMQTFLKFDNKESKIDLSPTEFKLLWAFCKNPSQVFSRDQLINMTWGDQVAVTDRVIDMHVSALRKKLGSKAIHLESVYGSGYRFTTDPS